VVAFGAHRLRPTIFLLSVCSVIPPPYLLCSVSCKYIILRCQANKKTRVRERERERDKVKEYCCNELQTNRARTHRRTRSSSLSGMTSSLTPLDIIGVGIPWGWFSTPSLLGPADFASDRRKAVEGVSGEFRTNEDTRRKGLVSRCLDGTLDMRSAIKGVGLESRAVICFSSRRGDQPLTNEDLRQ
jgi:hypothetical protein